MTAGKTKTSEESNRNLARWNPESKWYKPWICSIVKGVSMGVMRGLNRLTFIDRHHWETAFAQQERGVLTFSNHVSLFDDPLLIANLGRTKYEELRWIGADDHNFFGTPVKGFVYSAGKVVPLNRGGGLNQPGFDHLLERLRLGDWVHIFPEGGRTRDPKALLKKTFKRGIGKLIEGAQPIALPFYHYGMHKILPIGAKLPQGGNNIQVRFGAPVNTDNKWLEQFPQPTTAERWDAMAEWARTVLRGLEKSTNPDFPE